MNTDLLCEWLSIPKGGWPPENRILLGLPAGPLTVFEIETRALAQMERLRPHQIVQAELVTEGMNRLAQALIALMEEVSRAAGKPLVKDQSIDDLILDADRLQGPKNAPVILEAEVVSTVPTASKILAEQPRKSRPKKQLPKTKLLKPATQSATPPVEIPDVDPLPSGLVLIPSERRKAYAELVALRRLLKNWTRLQPFFAAPSETISTPAAVFGFVDSVRDCRRSIVVDGDRAWFDSHGQLVLALVKHPLALAIFRSLLRDQRQALAMDWAAAAANLNARYQGVRRELQLTKRKNHLNRAFGPIINGLNANPEWLMGILLLIAVIVAFVRTVSRASGAQ